MIRQIVDQYKLLQADLIAAGRRLWGVHQFLRANGIDIPPDLEPDDPDLAELYLKLDGWRKHPVKPDVWVP